MEGNGHQQPVATGGAQPQQPVMTQSLEQVLRGLIGHPMQILCNGFLATINQIAPADQIAEQCCWCLGQVIGNAIRFNPLKTVFENRDKMIAAFTAGIKSVDPVPQTMIDQAQRQQAKSPGVPMMLQLPTTK